MASSTSIACYFKNEKFNSLDPACLVNLKTFFAAGTKLPKRPENPPICSHCTAVVLSDLFESDTFVEERLFNGLSDYYGELTASDTELEDDSEEEQEEQEHAKAAALPSAKRQCVERM